MVRSLLPEGWEERARACGAVARLRGFASPEALLRTLLLHVARGYSLRETVVQAKAAGLAEVSDVALLKRLRKAETWLRELCLTLLQENQVRVAAGEPSRVLRLMDATVVKEPGPTGSLWRLHYSLQDSRSGVRFLRLDPHGRDGSGGIVPAVSGVSGRLRFRGRGLLHAGRSGILEPPGSLWAGAVE